MFEVVKLKIKDQIVDQERINQILKKLNLEANKRGVPEVLIEKLWKIMIEVLLNTKWRFMTRFIKKSHKVPQQSVF